MSVPFLDGKNTRPRLLVVRRDAVGDLICTTPLFAALRAHFPGARICALVNTYNSVVLDDNPDVDRVFAFPNANHWPAGMTIREKYGEIRTVLTALRREKFDCVIHASRSTSREDKIFGRLVGAGRLLRRNHDPEGAHEIVRTLSVLEPLGIKGTPAAPRVYPDRTKSRRAHAFLSASAAGPTPTAVHLSARNTENQWPLARYGEFLRSAVKEGGRFVVLWSPGASHNPGHPGDDEKAAVLRRELAGLPVAFWPTPTVTDLVATLAACSRFIGCDGGHCHVASALPIPVLGLYCEKKIAEWRPWGEPHAVVGAKTVGDIRTDLVLAAYRQMPEAAPPPWLDT
ncbi:MAG: glycosyltransferase family 9 protein [Gammaproteobacteria bacterium]|nr:glycosyltransferase family 9 protein [Gammaproteobacteria bacterium]